jgi:hypothetical protein
MLTDLFASSNFRAKIVRQSRSPRQTLIHIPEQLRAGALRHSDEYELKAFVIRHAACEC